MLDSDLWRHAGSRPPVCVIWLRESSASSKMIQTKVHIHDAKVPVIAFLFLFFQNPLSFVVVTCAKKKNYIARERPTRGRWRRTLGCSLVLEASQETMSSLVRRWRVFYETATPREFPQLSPNPSCQGWMRGVGGGGGGGWAERQNKQIRGEWRINFIS